jgi:alkanesulfonate monooxygenase SsuD/methylene tetrahydromethanopterin reductase-like flavin-dependent oxidoreductase (luciferase family)
MREWLIHHDLRSPDFGTPRPALYREALAMIAWADTRGCPRVVISEHHGSDDGYLPSPFVFGAAVAGRTEHVRIMISALVLTLRDPVATAEDAAVLDLISGGRLELTVVPGYVRDEFAMFGIPFERRGALFEEKLATFVDLLSGAPHTTDGHQVRITPLPVQRPRPLIIVGGAAPKRAARYGDAFLPAVADRHQAEVYREECRSLGKGDGILLWPGGPMWVFVTEDPERSWAELAPHALHEANAYAAWAAGAPGASPFEPARDVKDLQASGIFAVVTPEECIALARDLDPRAALKLKPLVAGFDPELGWRSLELFVDRVAPELERPLRPEGRGPGGGPPAGAAAS